MHFFAVLSRIFHTIVVGVMLVLTNSAAHPLPSPSSIPGPLPPSGVIAFMPGTTTPSGIEALIPSPFKNSKATIATTSPAQPIKKVSTVAATTTKPKALPKATPTSVVAPSPTPTETPKPAEQPQEVIPSADINAQARASVVNILCNVGGAGSLNPISGTGIIIDPSGIVVTNAHVGQFFLLRDYPVKNNIDCIIRTGNPARATYRAELLYFPFVWMQQNAQKIISQNPTGTGERDYSLLYITGRIDGTSLPASFPYLSPYVGDVFNLDDEILLAGYPAGFIEGITIQTNLFASSAFGKINEIFTFKDGGAADLISIPGTILSQKGASGGAAVRSSDGKIVGLIATATQADNTAQRDLRAITMGHIDRTLTEDTGHNLRYVLTTDPQASPRLFNLTLAPTLTKMLTTVLNR